MFLIPYNKLSGDQKGIIHRIAREPISLFVEGPPGSGKTLISLYVAKNIIENEIVQPLVLLYNFSLYGYLRTAFKELGIIDNITLATKDKLFWDMAGEYDIYPDKKDGYPEKYDYLLTRLMNVNLDKKWDIAIVDEVQDLNKKEWTLLKKLSGRITSMGDFNQGVYNTDLTRDDVTNRSLVERLFDIFRFHNNIAKVADVFSKRKEGLEEKVQKNEKKKVQIIDMTLENEASEIKKIISALKNQRDRIGIICPSKKKLAALHQSLNLLDVTNTFYSNNREFKNHNFKDTTPLLITSTSAKGLEFENVITFGFEEDDDFVKKLKAGGNLNEIIYVSLTRANSGLFILRTGNSVSAIRELKQEEENESPSMSLDDIFG